MNPEYMPPETVDEYLAAAAASFDSVVAQARGTPMERDLERAQLLCRAEVVILLQDRYNVDHRRAMDLAEDTIKIGEARTLN